MPIVPIMPTTVQIIRPFGFAVVGTYPARVVPYFPFGRQRFIGNSGFQATHYADMPLVADVRDSYVRNLGTPVIAWSEGDELRCALAGRKWRFVVSLVDVRYPDTAASWKRVFLIRDVVDWVTPYP